MLGYLVAVVVLLGAIALLLGAVLLFRKYGWPMKYLWAIPVIVLLGFGVWWGISSLGSSTPPTTSLSLGWFLEAPAPGKVWGWTKNYWLWLLIVFGVLVVVSLVIGGKWATVLQWSVGIVLILFFVVIPLVHATWSEKSPSQQQNASVARQPARALPQDAPDLPRAWNADGTMTDPSKWLRVQVPPHGDSVHVPSVFGGHIVWGGSGFKIRYVYSDGHECALGDVSPSCRDGDIVEGYARNEGDTPLTASYAYARINEK